MRRPPPCVALVARTHGAVGLSILFAIGLAHALTRDLPMVAWGGRTYAITGGLAGVYLLASALIWFGAPGGRLLSRICGLLYLSRPRFGSPLWEIMDSAEFQKHCRRR
ncbi:MAG: hypothetical protein RL077_4978 [Verrucomicrobiota bacterium]|jgi:hypothetical protein